MKDSGGLIFRVYDTKYHNIVISDNASAAVNIHTSLRPLISISKRQKLTYFKQLAAQYPYINALSSIFESFHLIKDCHAHYLYVMILSITTYR